MNPGDQITTGRLAEARFLPNGYVGIIIRNNPIKLSDASIIAHELAHVVLRDGGYPLVGHYRGCDDSEIIYLGFSLNNMIHDPLVIKMLLNYGFDLRPEYQKECLNGIKKLKRENQYSGIRRIIGSFIYIQDLLENKLLFLGTDGPCRKFIEKVEDLTS